MTNVASLELSKTLYELSGWDDSGYIHNTGNGRTYEASVYFGMFGEVIHKDDYCVYDLGYLLRKLPIFTHVFQHENGWQANTMHQQRRNWVCDGYSPEDALCELAIELFKSGVLKREEQA